MHRVNVVSAFECVSTIIVASLMAYWQGMHGLGPQTVTFGSERRGMYTHQADEP